MSSRPNLNCSTNTPGPGTYESNTTRHEVPSMKMTLSKRDFRSDNANPGPGSYNTTRPRSSAPLYGFGSSNRNGFRKHYTPGPGAYNQQLSTLQSQFGKTFMKKTNLKTYGKDNPGPGAYNPVKNQRMTVSNVRIGSAVRESLNNKQLVGNPGPGQYSSDYNLTKRSNPNYRMGQEKREIVQKMKNPGPGNYEIPSKMIEGPRFGMCGKNERKNKQGNPGPGSYMPNHNCEKENSVALSFGRSLRDAKKKNSQPGPGMYEFKSESKKKQPQYRLLIYSYSFFIVLAIVQEGTTRKWTLLGLAVITFLLNSMMCLNTC